MIGWPSQDLNAINKKILVTIFRYDSTFKGHGRACSRERCTAQDDIGWVNDKVFRCYRDGL